MNDSHVTICEKCGGDRVFFDGSFFGECKNCDKLNIESEALKNAMKHIDEVFAKESSND